MTSRKETEHPRHEGGRLHVACQGQVCNGLSPHEVFECKHPEKPVLEMLIGILLNMFINIYI